MKVIAAYSRGYISFAKESWAKAGSGDARRPEIVRDSLGYNSGPTTGFRYAPSPPLPDAISSRKGRAHAETHVCTWEELEERLGGFSLRALFSVAIS